MRNQKIILSLILCFFFTTCSKNSKSPPVSLLTAYLIDGPWQLMASYQINSSGSVISKTNGTASDSIIFASAPSSNLNVTLTTYMNYNLLSVKESICKDKRIASTSSLTSFSNIIFYLTYEPSIIENEINEGTIQVSYINHIDPRWIIPANPLLFNPKYYSELSKYILNNNNIYYINNSEYYNYLVRVISNNWNENVTIWNMKKMPILQKYLQKVNNIISMYK